MQLSKYSIPLICFIASIVSTTQVHAQQKVRIRPVEETKVAEETSIKPSLIETKQPEKKSTPKKNITYTYWKDTLYTTTARVPADVFLEPYTTFGETSKPFQSCTEIGYYVNLETKDTSRAYRDGADDKMVFDKQMRYLHHYLLFPMPGTDKDSAYLVCNYYYDGAQKKYKVHFNLDGTYSSRQEYKYDNLGNLIYENYVVTDEKGIAILKPNSSSQTLYQYHNNKEITQLEFVYNEDAQAFVLSKTHKITLDDKARIIRKDIWDNIDNRQAYLVDISYPNPLEEQRISNSYGNINHYGYKYNKKKELIATSDGTGDDKSTSTYKYKYDKHGNWIQRSSEFTRTSYETGGEERYLDITKRTITY